MLSHRACARVQVLSHRACGGILCCHGVYLSCSWSTSPKSALSRAKRTSCTYIRPTHACTLSPHAPSTMPYAQPVHEVSTPIVLRVEPISPLCSSLPIIKPISLQYSPCSPLTIAAHFVPDNLHSPRINGSLSRTSLFCGVWHPSWLLVRRIPRTMACMPWPPARADYSGGSTIGTCITRSRLLNYSTCTTSSSAFS